MLTGRARLAAAALILAPALLYLGLDDTTQQQSSAPQPETVLQQSDYYLVKARIREYAQDGLLKQQLSAEQLEHQPQQQQLLAVAPKIRLFSAGKPPVDISSLNGVMLDHQDLISLTGQVFIQDNPDRQQASTIEAEALTIYPDKKFAHTDTKVTLSNSTGVTTAVGMTADFNSKTIELLSQVKGLHNAN